MCAKAAGGGCNLNLLDSSTCADDPKNTVPCGNIFCVTGAAESIASSDATTETSNEAPTDEGEGAE